MLKNLLRLLVSSTTFVALMLVANLAIANPVQGITAPETDHLLMLVGNQQPSSSINLNVVSSSLKFADQFNDSQLDHSGCSCAVCMQII
jgi:hypothetical protein